MTASRVPLQEIQEDEQLEEAPTTSFSPTVSAAEVRQSPVSYSD